MTTIADLPAVRAHDPGRIARALRERTPGALPAEPDATMLVVAADHPGRGALAVGSDPWAMADRRDLLERCAVALARPGVDGFLGTADLVEDLTLLGALEGKVVLGSMNRGGLAGAVFELDDRFTGYDADAIVEAGLDGGKMLLRLDPADDRSVVTLEACARAVDALAARRRIALVEPFLVSRVDGRVRTDLTTDAVVRSVAIASGLGRTSAYTWLKVPCAPDMERVAAASTLPLLILGGEPSADPEATRRDWDRALRLPSVRGLVTGRTLLYPPDGDVAGAVDRLVEML
jgi:hypothetical protein